MLEVLHFLSSTSWPDSYADGDQRELQARAGSSSEFILACFWAFHFWAVHWIRLSFLSLIRRSFFPAKTAESMTSVQHFRLSTSWPDSCAAGGPLLPLGSVDFIGLSATFSCSKPLQWDSWLVTQKFFSTARIAESMTSALHFLLSTCWPDSCEAGGPQWGPELEVQRSVSLLKRVIFKACPLSLRAQKFCFCIDCFPFRKVQ